MSCSRCTHVSRAFIGPVHDQQALPLLSAEAKPDAHSEMLSAEPQGDTPMPSDAIMLCAAPALEGADGGDPYSMRTRRCIDHLPWHRTMYGSVAASMLKDRLYINSSKSMVWGINMLNFSGGVCGAVSSSIPDDRCPPYLTALRIDCFGPVVSACVWNRNKMSMTCRFMHLAASILYAQRQGDYAGVCANCLAGKAGDHRKPTWTGFKSLDTRCDYLRL